MERIVNSYNLFIDSSHAITSGCKGDDFHVNLQDSGVHAGEGQIIRLTLDNFSMHKNFFDVNDTNNTFLLKSNVSPAGTLCKLTKQNITSLNQLATDFQAQIVEGLKTQTNSIIAQTTTGLEPGNCACAPGIIKFSINVDPNIRSVSIEFPEDSDIYQLLGGDRLTAAAIGNFNSVTCAVDTGNHILTVTGLYPAQMSTTPFVYIRCPGTSNTNLETSSMSGAKDASAFENLTTHSYILGRAMVDTYYVQYNPSTGREFFLDLKQSQLNSLELRLTDAKNRPLGRANGSSSLTAAGTGTAQSTLGNLEFTAVLRIDIIQKREVNALNSQKIEPRIPARFSQILQKQGNGKDEFGKSPGFQ